jgi:hypothetical protein
MNDLVQLLLAERVWQQLRHWIDRVVQRYDASNIVLQQRIESHSRLWQGA